MAVARKPFQGVLNIIRFNWHFYVFAALVFALLLATKHFFPHSVQSLILITVCLAVAAIAVSLLVSLYVYDRSDLYQLNWLNIPEGAKALNIHSGFDETSEIIQDKFPSTEMTICDFYNQKNTPKLQ